MESLLHEAIRLAGRSLSFQHQEAATKGRTDASGGVPKRWDWRRSKP